MNEPMAKRNGSSESDAYSGGTATGYIGNPCIPPAGANRAHRLMEHRKLEIELKSLKKKIKKLRSKCYYVKEVNKD